MRHRDPDGAALIRSIFESVPHPTEGGLLGPVFARGEPLIVPEVPDELLRGAYPRPEHGAYFDRFGVTSLILSPMRASSGRTLGVVAAAAEHSRSPFTDADVLVATDLCRRVTLALENARLHAEAAGTASRLHAIVEASTDAVITIDATGTVVDANAATEAIFGWRPEALVGRSIEVLMPVATALRHAGFLERYLDGAPPRVIGQRRVVEARRSDGRRFWAELSVAEIAGGDTPLFTGFVRDVSERMQHEAELSRLAERDELTGLLNRRAIAREVEERLRDVDEHGGMAAVVFLDLDDFKAVNDERGHDVGDAVLRIAARRVRSCVRTDDAIGRWGGDELLVAARREEDRDAAGDAAAIADRVREAVDGPVRVDDAPTPVHLSASVGWSVYPRDAPDVQGLVRHADQAMFAAKRAR